MGPGRPLKVSWPREVFSSHLEAADVTISLKPLKVDEDLRVQMRRPAGLAQCRTTVPPAGARSILECPPIRWRSPEVANRDG